MAEGDGLRRYLTTKRSGKFFVYGLCVVLAVVLIAVAGHDIVRHINAMERWIAGLGAWGPAAFVMVYVVATSLLIPESALAVMAGVLFGFGVGFGSVIVGALLAAGLQYWLACSLLEPRLTRRLASRPDLTAIRNALHREELKVQVLLRAAPINPATLNYLLGATGVRFPGFLIGCLAMTHHLLLEVYLGYAGRHFVRVAGSAQQTELHDVVLVLGLVAAVAAVWLVSRKAHRALLEAAREAARDAPTPPGRAP